MGRKSTKENKNVYQTSRESLGLTREAAAEKLEFLSADRIEKIESEKSLPHPDEILAMADCYKNPSLCNYYCSHECPIGQECVPEVQMKDLSQITLEMLASLNTLNRDKDRLIEIARLEAEMLALTAELAEIKKLSGNAAYHPISGHCTTDGIGTRHLPGCQRPNGVELCHCAAGRPNQRCGEHDVHDFQCIQ